MLHITLPTYTAYPTPSLSLSPLLLPILGKPIVSSLDLLPSFPSPENIFIYGLPPVVLGLDNFISDPLLMDLVCERA